MATHLDLSAEQLGIAADVVADTAERLRVMLADSLPLLVARRDDAERAEVKVTMFKAGARAFRPGTRDNRVYAAGAAIERAGGLDLCDVTLAGLFAAGSIGTLWLAEAMAELIAVDPHTGHTLTDAARRVFSNDERRRYLLAVGMYVCWQQEASAYESETREFAQSRHGRDPHASWRRQPVTWRQRYLVSRIEHIRSAAEPDFAAPPLATAGEAHDWIKAEGGSPRFSTPPLMPVMEAGAPGWKELQE